MNPTTRFQLRLPVPGTHLLQVTMEILAVGEESEIEVFLPVWTPGSYFVREYAQYVSKVRATADDGSQRIVQKKTKCSWLVKTTGTNTITLDYTVYGYNLNVRYNHIDHSHAFIHGPATFLHLPSRRDEPVDVEIAIPAGWNAFTGLAPIEGMENGFRAKHADNLYDCPIELGPHTPVEFTAAGKPHEMVFWGQSNVPKHRLESDVARIVATAADIFGGEVPYDKYTFITLLSDQSYGGLEHANSTALMFPRLGFRDGVVGDELVVEDEKYVDFLSLVSHEFFHVWNVKRIRPEALNRIDYQTENYTRDLWTVEGVTSYYTDLVLLRAELITPRRYLDRVAKSMANLAKVPGRFESSLEMASFDAWIRAYRPDPHNHNSTVSYYLKGSLIALILDLMIRVDTAGKKSLDDVMIHLWATYGKEDGYHEGAYEEIVGEVIGHEVGDFFDAFIRGTEDPDWAEWFENMGLTVTRTQDETPFIGFAMGDDGRVTTVDYNGPAAPYISPGDQVIAIDGYQIMGHALDGPLKTYSVGDRVNLHLFREGRIQETVLELGENPQSKFEINVREDLDEVTAALLTDWLGTDKIDA